LLLITSAISFEGKWKEPFQEEDTNKQPFTNFNGDQKQVDMMHQNDHVKYLDNKKFQAISKQYGESFECVIVLPKEFKKQFYLSLLSSFKHSSSAISSKKFSLKKVDFSVPKFSFSYEINLNNTLKSLGLLKAFTNNAEFAELLEGEHDLFVSKVIHKTFFKF